MSNRSPGGNEFWQPLYPCTRFTGYSRALFRFFVTLGRISFSKGVKPGSIRVKSQSNTNNKPMKFSTTLQAALALGALSSTFPAHSADGRDAEVLHQFTLVPTSLAAFGYSAAEVAAAQGRGLAFTDLPAIGSGLQRLNDNHFLGVTDRGASFTVGTVLLRWSGVSWD